MIVTGPNVTAWVASRTNEFGDFSASQAIGWARDGRILAGVVYAQFNGPSVVCHIASDGSRKWLTRAFLWTIFDYPFRQLNVKRITVCVGEGNAASRKFVEHLGFTEKARLEESHPTGSLIVYQLRKPECRWLHLRESENERMAA